MWVEKCLDKVFGCMLGCVGGGEGGKHGLGGEEFNGVGDAGGVGFSDIDLVAMVVL